MQETSHLKANLDIIEKIKQYAEENPTQRFNQILFNLGVTQKDMSIRYDTCNYNEPSIDTICKVDQSLREMKRKTNK